MSLFRKKPKRVIYRTPQGTRYSLYEDMLKQPHLLLAGATGSGKSVVINGLVEDILLDAPTYKKMILIDPKRVELVEYKTMPHTLCYASEPGEIINALQFGLDLIEKRYKEMQRERTKLYTGGDVYIIIDELADLMTTNKKQVLPLLQRICQIGRASRVHVIAATQTPIAVVIPTPLKVNFDSRVGLRTRSAQDSRNILGFNGCEVLPRYGQGFYMTPERTTLYEIPMIEQAEIERLISWWEAPGNVRYEYK